MCNSSYWLCVINIFVLGLLCLPCPFIITSQGSKNLLYVPFCIIFGRGEEEVGTCLGNRKQQGNALENKGRTKKNKEAFIPFLNDNKHIGPKPASSHVGSSGLFAWSLDFIGSTATVQVHLQKVICCLFLWFPFKHLGNLLSYKSKKMRVLLW